MEGEKDGLHREKGKGREAILRTGQKLEMCGRERYKEWKSLKWKSIRWKRVGR